jgi:beta-phosphoglucomutase
MGIVQQIIKKHRLNLSIGEVEQIMVEKNKLFVHLIKHNLTPNDVINGIRQLINDAISRGLQLVAISSSANAVLEMKCLGLYNKFSYVSSYDKPFLNSLSPQEKQTTSPLLLALKTLGIKANECIGLEDRIDGIIEFKNVGIFSVAITHYHEDIKKVCDY